MKETKEKNVINDISYRKVIGITAIVCAGILLVINIKSVIEFLDVVLKAFNPLLYGLIVACVLNVPMTALESLLARIPGKHRKWIRPTAVALTYVLALLLISLVTRIVVPQLIDSMTTLYNNLSTYAGSVSDTLNEFFKTIGLSLRINLGDMSSSLIKVLETSLQTWFSNLSSVIDLVSGGIISNVATAAKVVINILITTLAAILISIYLLVAKEKYISIVKRVGQAVFTSSIYERLLSFCQLVSSIFNGFIGGFLTEMCILGTLFYIVLSISNMPYALLISVVIALTSIMPYVGTTMAMIFGAFIILADRGIWTVLIFIIEFTVVQQVENNLIYPRVVGRSVGIPSFYVLLAISIFGGLFGALGLIIAVPFMALIYTLVRNFVNRRLAKKEAAEPAKPPVSQ